MGRRRRTGRRQSAEAALEGTELALGGLGVEDEGGEVGLRESGGDLGGGVAEDGDHGGAEGAEGGDLAVEKGLAVEVKQRLGAAHAGRGSGGEEDGRGLG
ncbi:MAG: hypothetical protein QM757_02165 [Paludibaculum sp.]